MEKLKKLNPKEVSKRELAEVIGSESACGGWKVTDISISFQWVLLLSVIFL